MRLTLRTLLAYLDNTLEPADAETLRAKVAESGFAGQLIQRIRASLSNSSLGAPAPDAAGPIEEANIISEYLDSTLPGEQVSEIERACLESSVQLAEAAACHQILTIVLGKSAEVPPELRQRIYALPDNAIANIANAKSFSSVSIPKTSSSINNVSDNSISENESPSASDPELDSISEAAAMASEAVSQAGSVAPVGPGDSGVSDAPTRIRQSDLARERGSGGDGIIGSRPRSAVEAAQMYGGSIRTSRIAPWLVSLALAGVLLFALVRTFDPLINPTKIAENPSGEFPDRYEDEGDFSASDLDNRDRKTPEIEVSAEDAPMMVPVGKPAVDIAPDVPPTNPQEAPIDEEELMEDLPLPTPMPAPNAETIAPKNDEESELLPAVNAAKPQPNTDAPVSVIATDSDPVMRPLDSPLVTPRKEIAADDANVTDARVDDAGLPDPSVAEPISEMEENAPPEKTDVAADSADATKPAEEIKPAVATESVEGSGKPMAVGAIPPPLVKVKEPARPMVLDAAEGLAKLTSDASLVFAIGNDGAPLQLTSGAVVGSQREVICAPTYRVRFDTVDELAVTLIGPAKVYWTSEKENAPVLHIVHGRVLIEAIKPNVTANLDLAGQELTLNLPAIESLVAVTTVPFRSPGLDPLKPENHVNTLGVIVSQGKAKLSAEGEDVELTTGQRWVRRGSDKPTVANSPAKLDWVAAPDENDRSLESSARETLLGLAIEGQSVELWLREATMFRRSEVGALAARTMLAISRPDVYFGGDGILNNAEQRSYWPDHFTALQSAVDRDAETAEVIRDAIKRMDAANANTIFQLLVGFSQKQLIEGADEELVRQLDSPSMCVRALALENLRKITGTTLSFRPEQDNAPRRVQAVKKWEARLRKSDIRWAQP